MNDEARRRLKQLLDAEGRELLRNPQRCRGLLQDYCAGFRPEVSALLAALNEDVPRALLAAAAGAPQAAVVAAQVRRLQSELNLKPDAARWAVESWASALDVTRQAESPSPPVVTEESETEPLIEKPPNPEQEQGWWDNPHKRRRRKLAVIGLACVLALAAGAWLLEWSRGNQPPLVLKSGDMVKALGWSPDGRRVESGGASGEAQVWDASTGKQVAALRVDNGSEMISMAWSRGGNRLTTGNKDGSLKVWNVESGKLLETLGAPGPDLFPKDSSFASFLHRAPVLALAWSPDGQRFAEGEEDSGVGVWDVQAGKMLLGMDAKGGKILCLAWSPQGRLLAAGDQQGSVVVWDTQQGKVVDDMTPLPKEAIWSVAWSPDGQTLATGNATGAVWLWSGEGHPRVLDGGGDETIWSLAWSPDGRRLATASEDGTVRVWEVGTQKQVRALKVTAGAAAMKVAWSPNGKRLAAGDDRGAITVWDAASGGR